MKHNINVLAVLLFSSMVLGCKKENTNTPSTKQPQNCKVIAYNDDNGQPFLKLDYNPEGGLARSTKADGSYTNYSYSGNQLSLMEYDNQGKFKKSVPATINKWGFIETTNDGWFTIKANYDDNGYLTRFQLFEPDNSLYLDETYKIVDGNAVEKNSTVYNTTGPENFKYLYEYSDKLNAGHLPEEIYGFFYSSFSHLYKKPYKNMISKINTKTYIYTFDDDGLPTQMKAYLNGSLTESRKYSFSCDK